MGEELEVPVVQSAELRVKALECVLQGHEHVVLELGADALRPGFGDYALRGELDVAVFAEKRADLQLDQRIGLIHVRHLRISGDRRRQRLERLFVALLAQRADLRGVLALDHLVVGFLERIEERDLEVALHLGPERAPEGRLLRVHERRGLGAGDPPFLPRRADLLHEEVDDGRLVFDVREVGVDERLDHPARGKAL